MTEGPWKELGSTRLLDISLQVTHSLDHSHFELLEEYHNLQGASSPLTCWAVATNGEALYRLGVRLHRISFYSMQINLGSRTKKGKYLKCLPCNAWWFY